MFKLLVTTLLVLYFLGSVLGCAQMEQTESKMAEKKAEPVAVEVVKAMVPKEVSPKIGKKAHCFFSQFFPPPPPQQQPQPQPAATTAAPNPRN